MMRHRAVRSLVNALACMVLGISGTNMVAYARGVGGKSMAWRAAGPGMALSSSVCFTIIAICLLLMSIRLARQSPEEGNDHGERER